MAEQESGPAWIEAFAAAIGVEPPDAAAVEMLLDLAGVAAHASERIAAPIACYLVGRAGLDPTAALVAARQVSGQVPGQVSGPV